MLPYLVAIGTDGETDPVGGGLEPVTPEPGGHVTGDDLPCAASAWQVVTPGGQSFTPATRVLLPGGKTASISSLKPGDKVTAADTKTGKDQTETVTAVEVHHDTDLYNLTVKTAHGTQVIHTTSSHLFWDPYQHQWIASNKLAKGEHLKTADGTIAVADGGTTPKQHDGWMWDLTVPGNNDHDFYVQPGATAVLVHNDNGTQGCSPAEQAAALQSAVEKRASEVIASQSTRVRGPVLSGDRYPSGMLKGESWFREGVQHGTAREYDEDGRASSEAVYEYGILISRSQRDQDGRLRQVYRLADDSPHSRLLERFRHEKGWPQNVLASVSRLPAVLA